MALRKFGETLDGAPVYLAALSAGDVSAEIITYGATIHKILAPDRNGEIADVILGKDDMAGYLAAGAPAASVIGRVANRIGNHSFSINGKRYILEANIGKSILHSASGNYAHKNFAVVEATDSLLRLALRDNGEAGFPGEVSVEVCYDLDDDGTLYIDYTAIPTHDTPINLTNHVYFNLAGQDSGVADGQTLTIKADYYTASDARDITTGEILKVRGTPLDFTKPRKLGEALAALEKSGDRRNGFDFNYVLRGSGWRKIAEACDEDSGRALEVFTDLPGVQLYTANYLADGAEGKNGAKYRRHSGFCLETQFFPDTANKPFFPDGIAYANEVFSTSTAFRFHTV